MASVGEGLSGGGTFKECYDMLVGLTQDGSAKPVLVSGGRYLWKVDGSFDGATATLEALSCDGTDWDPVVIDAGPVVMAVTTARTLLIDGIGEGAIVRVTVSNAGAATKLNSTLSGY